MRHTVSPLLGRLLWPLSVRRLFSPAPTTQAFEERYPFWMSLRPSQLRASAAESARMIPPALSLLQHHRMTQVPTVVIAWAGARLVNTRLRSSLLAGRLNGAGCVSWKAPGTWCITARRIRSWQRCIKPRNWTGLNRNRSSAPKPPVRERQRRLMHEQPPVRLMHEQPPAPADA